MTLPELLHLLRTTELPQCTSYLGHNGACCAMGVIALELGFAQSDLEAHGSAKYTKAWTAVHTQLDALGIDSSLVWANNDRGYTFPEIATEIEQALGLETEPLL